LVVDPSFLQSVNVSILPRDDATYDLGSSLYRWANGFFSGIVDAGGFSIGGENLALKHLVDVDSALAPADGQVLMYDDALGVWTAGEIPTPDLSSVITDILPSVDNTYNIGSPSFRWKDGYFAGVLNIRTAGTAFSSDRIRLGNPGNNNQVGIWFEDPTAPTYGVRVYYDDTSSKLYISVINDLVETPAIVVDRINGRVGIGGAPAGSTYPVKLYGPVVSEGLIVPNADATHDLGSSGYRWKNGYFANLLADGISKFAYVVREHNDLDFISSQHALSAWVALASDTITYGTVEPDTIIYKNGKVVVVADGPQTGTISVSAGDILTTNGKPVGFVAQGSQYSIAPLSLAGKYFGFYSNRKGPQTIYIYAPFGPAYVEYYENGIKGEVSPTATVLVNQGEIVTLQSTQQEPVHHRIYSTAPIVVTKQGSGADHEIIPPASHEVLLSQTAAGYGTMFGGTVYNINGDYFYSEDDLVYAMAIADGAGVDCDAALPWKACGDTYIIPHPISGYAIIALEPTIVRVYYWDSANSQWVLYKEHDLTSASRTNPIKVQEADQAGDEADIITNVPILVTGDRPFYLRTNDESADEYPVLGYRSGKRLPPNFSMGDIKEVLVGTTANRPAAGVAYRLYISTDEQIIYLDDGSSWIPLGAVFK